MINSIKFRVIPARNSLAFFINAVLYDPIFVVLFRGIKRLKGNYSQARPGLLGWKNNHMVNAQANPNLAANGMVVVAGHQR